MEELVGRAVKNELPGLGIVHGTVKSYDPINGYFEIAYEDGDSEEMDFNEVAAILDGKVDPSAVEKIQQRSAERRPKKRRRLEGACSKDSGNSSVFPEKDGIFVEPQLTTSGENVETLEKKCGVGGELSKSYSINGKLNENHGFGRFDLNVDISMGEEDGVFETNAKPHDDLERSMGRAQKVEHSFDINLGLDEEIEEIQVKGFRVEGEFNEVATNMEGGSNDSGRILAKEDNDETQLKASSGVNEHLTGNVCLKKDGSSTVIKETQLMNGNGSSENVIEDVSLKENNCSIATEETQLEDKTSLCVHGSEVVCLRKDAGVRNEDEDLGGDCRDVSKDLSSTHCNLKPGNSDMVVQEPHEDKTCLKPLDVGASSRKKRGRPKKSKPTTQTDDLIQHEERDLGESCRGVTSENTGACCPLEVGGSTIVTTENCEGTTCSEPPDKGAFIRKKRGRPKKSTSTKPADVIIQNEHKDLGEDSRGVASNCTNSYLHMKVDCLEAAVAENHENKTFPEPPDKEAYNCKKRGRPKKVKPTPQAISTMELDDCSVVFAMNHEDKTCSETPDKKTCSGKKRGRPSKAKSPTQMVLTRVVGGADTISTMELDDCNLIFATNHEDGTCSGTPDKKTCSGKKRGRPPKAKSPTQMALTRVVGGADITHAGKENGTCLGTPDKKECVLSLAAADKSCTPKKRGRPSRESNSQTVLRRSSRKSSSASLNHVLNVDESLASNDASSHENNVVLDSNVDGFREQTDLPPKPELPPSSRNLNINDISIIDLFSVYSCLRSFSTVLFLSPFSLEAFLEALKDGCPNSLIDSIHFSILHTLKLHMEFLSEEGSQFATNCLRSLNWALLDTVTWPIYVSEYLLFRDSSLKPGFELSYLKFLMDDYYKQSPSVKIWVLQCLCDDVIEAESVRSEINRRTQASELDIDVDRIPNTEMKKKRKDQMDEGGGSCLTQDVVDEAADWNSDECCLCKMDGSLICCDGCPAAYHSRCVGLVKDSLPEGEWFCPECDVNRHGIRMKSSNSLRGADLLGIDPHGRLYFGTCGYLLVLDSCDPESSYNFYNNNDLIVVIEALKSSSILYANIIDAISKNWGVFGEEGYQNSQADTTCKVLHLNGQISPSIGGSLTDTTEVKSVVKQQTIPVRNEDFDLQGYNLSESVIKHDLRLPSDSIATRESLKKSVVTKSSRVVEVHCIRQEIGKDFSKEPSKTPSQSDIYREAHSTIEHSFQSTVSCVGLEKNVEAAASSRASVAMNRGQMHSGSGYYVNCYTFGQTAASVGRELTRITLEKAKEGFQWSLEDIISAQLRAISENSTYFCWSNRQGLHQTAEQEDCGWCFYCKNPTENETCLFKMTCKKPAVDGLEGGAVTLCSKKSQQTHLFDVICYMLSIEGRLSGLLLGPWKNASYSSNWRKNILKAPDVASVKHFLLTLESNLRHLTFLPEWFKHVDSVVTMGSASHVMTTAAPVSSSKPVGGRKRAKYTVVQGNPSFTAAPKTSTFWWRGGGVSRQLFNYKVLPRSLASKGGRQAGCKKISDMLYPDGSEFAKRSKFIAWRASVEMSTSVAHLAYQVRELDFNIRWDDLENTRDFYHLSKESRKAMKLFKKVIIRRKITDGAKAKYLLDFGKRRAIPKIVKRNGKMLEASSSERKKYWLEESLVPLHILKAYEEKKVARTSSKMKPRPLDEVGKNLKKSSRKSGLSNLLSRGQKPENYKCGHCNKDVLIREAVSCQDCEGFFHKRHVRKSDHSSATECSYQCHRCRCGDKIAVLSPLKAKPKKKKTQSQKNKKALQQQKSKKTSTNGQRKPLPRKVKYMPVQGKKLLGTKKGTKKGNRAKSKSQQPKKELCWFKGGRSQVSYAYWINGLRLTKNSNDARAMQFRESKLLLPPELPSADIVPPKCHLCSEACYRSTAIYVNCEDCKEWFHGEAFGITTENSCMILGFRCHMCRKRSPPTCPYAECTN